MISMRLEGFGVSRGFFEDISRRTHPTAAARQLDLCVAATPGQGDSLWGKQGPLKTLNPKP